MNIKIFQSNLHRSKTVDDLLIISEQCQTKDDARWYGDALSTTAIWIPGVNRIVIEDHASERGCVKATLLHT